ncbi:hypothetical protein [Streptomyces johnsoniae]|uniref:Uncharacterized protein n=1 Tax=Streptomyces johnsoniae TaxID=3075532 RepID=A0ABU2SAL2_9ACTN|nr:hypothetical protein [Streptomyces sp. DSM 41886]MDT0445963.1 hypothetical protein [Streptomyces sp. DSM 41886]
MAKKKTKNATVVNVATPGSVVGIQSGGDVNGNTVVVNGNTVTADDGGRWVDFEDMDRSLIDDID